MLNETELLEFVDAVEKLSNQDDGSSPDQQLVPKKDNENLTL